MNMRSVNVTNDGKTLESNMSPQINLAVHVHKKQSEARKITLVPFSKYFMSLCHKIC